MDATQMEQLAALEAMKKQFLSKILDKEAFERLGRVRAVNQALAGQAELYLIKMYQEGKIPGPLNDSKLKDVLTAISEKRDIKIQRK